MRLSDLFKKMFNMEVPAGCGHKTRPQGEVEVFGVKELLVLNVKDGKVECCHKCMAKMAQRCYWCDGVIWVGSNATLITTEHGGKLLICDRLPCVLRSNRENEHKLYCVKRHSCEECIGGLDMYGRWVAPGEFVPFDVLFGR